MSDLTVIMTSHNSEKTIAKSIQSILCQTYIDFNLLIIDDASTDNTLKVISQFKDNRLSVVSLEKNVGAGAARNLGIQSTKTKYIMFIDSDDTYERERVEYMMSLKSDDEKAINRTERLICNFKNSTKVKKHRSTRKPYGAAVTFLLNRDFIIKNDIKFSDRKVGEDTDFRKRLINHGAFYYDLPYKEDTNYVYIQHLNSLSDFEGEETDTYKEWFRKVYGSKL